METRRSGLPHRHGLEHGPAEGAAIDDARGLRRDPHLGRVDGGRDGVRHRDGNVLRGVVGHAVGALRARLFRNPLRFHRRMDPFRKAPPRTTDLETEALRDLLRRTRRLRRRTALPAMIVGLIAAFGGMAAHITGLWSVFGGSDHQGYYVTAFSLGAAALVCAAPLVLPAAVLYLVLRARVRGTWNAAHATHGVPAEFLAENVRRFD